MCIGTLPKEVKKVHMHLLFKLRYLAFLQLYCYLALTRGNAAHPFFYIPLICQSLSGRVAFHFSIDTCTRQKNIWSRMENKWTSTHFREVSLKQCLKFVIPRVIALTQNDLLTHVCIELMTQEQASSTEGGSKVTERYAPPQSLPDAIRSQRND